MAEQLMSAKFDTPLPGRLVPEPESGKLIDCFLRLFRKENPRTNLPTACLIGDNNTPETLQSPKFKRLDTLFFYVEPRLLQRATPADILGYLDTREPWEDYNICLFDDTFRWCIGITHEDKVFVADPEGCLS